MEVPSDIYCEYEVEKAKLSNLPPEEYEEAIMALAERLGM